MSEQSFIGGNLQAIEDAAARLVESGTVAVATGTETKSAADQLEIAIASAMDDLLRRFEQIAATLTDDVTASHQQLVGSDWRGASRDNAVQIKEHLQGQINTVLGTATSNLGTEKSMFLNRAAALVSNVETEFNRVMHEIDGEYTSLANASRRTMENLAAADQTIAMT